MGKGIEVNSKAVNARLNKLLNNAKSPRVFLQKVVLPRYIKTQIKRFATNNNDPDFDNQRWDDLSPRYLKWKRSFKGVKAQGNQTLVLTGRLYEALTMKSGDSLKLIGDNFMVVGVKEGSGFEYPSKVGTDRPFMHFSKDWYKQIRTDFKKWFVGKE